MISRLPPWLWVGAWALAMIAGVVNVVGLLSFDHHAVTHLTGNTSLLADAIVQGDLQASLHFLVLIGAFVSGTVVSGFIVQDTALQLGRRYGAALLLESLLLVAALVFLKRSSSCGLYAMACACGLQNAMVSTYSGAIVRTTHVSGMFTDLGIFLGHGLRGLPVDRRRLGLCVIVISGFLAGGLIGAVGFSWVGYSIVWLPALLTGLAGSVYGAWATSHKKRS